MTLAEQILTVLCTIAPDVDAATVDRARPLVDQLDLDSMDYQSFLAALATRYQLDFPEVDLPALRSIDDLVAYVLAHGRRGAA